MPAALVAKNDYPAARSVNFATNHHNKDHKQRMRGDYDRYCKVCSISFVVAA
jgi:hypothetical protein